jgi:hypothetical protein
VFKSNFDKEDIIKLSLFFFFYIAHQPFKPGLIAQLENGEQLWMVEAEAHAGGLSGENGALGRVGGVLSRTYQLPCSPFHKWYN